MARVSFNDGHYLGPEPGQQCLFAGWSPVSPGLSLVAPALLLHAASDLLALVAHGCLAPVPSRTQSDHIPAS